MDAGLQAPVLQFRVPIPNLTGLTRFNSSRQDCFVALDYNLSGQSPSWSLKLAGVRDYYLYLALSSGLGIIDGQPRGKFLILLRRRASRPCGEQHVGARESLLHGTTGHPFGLCCEQENHYRERFSQPAHLGLRVFGIDGRGLTPALQRDFCGREGSILAAFGFGTSAAINSNVFMSGASCTK